MSQARRALVALISVIAVALGFAPAAFTSVAAAASAAPSSSARAVHTAVNTPGPGYWLVASDGGVFANGAADFHGSTGATALNKPIVGIAATPTGNGYWMVASDGGIFAFGDATFHGSTGAMALNKPIVGMTSTPKGNGYLLVASDGGIFAFGDATFHGSTGAMSLNKPITGIASTPTGNGYWMVASDGGIFSFGDAHFFGSTGATTLNMPIVGMAASHTGNGYWFVAADGGVFAFGDAHFFGTASTQALNMPIVGMAASAPMVAAPPPATKLAFTTEPSATATGGAAFAIQPVVTVQDTSGATVPTDTSAVALAITTPAGATLACTANPSTAVSGVATFAGCNINRPGTYTLSATDGVLTSATSASITITIGPAAKVGFSQQPSGAVSLVNFATQPIAAVQDLGGNTVTTATTGTVTLSITTPGGATLTCTSLVVNVASGLAPFAGCHIDLSGTYTLHGIYSIGALAGNSGSLSITAAGAMKLAFTTSPSSSTGGVAFGTQPVVKVQDASGNTVLTDNSSVLLSITTPAGATLACTGGLSKAAVAGVATFVGCAIDLANVTPYTLHAADGVLTPAGPSGPTTITVGAPTHLAFTVQPVVTGVNGATFTTSPTATVKDAGNNTVTGATSVTLSITGTPANTSLTCTSTLTVVATLGVAPFTGCALTGPEATYTLTATDTAAQTGVSGNVTINAAGLATHMLFTTQPVVTGVNEATFTTSPTATVKDVSNNTVTGATSVTLSITGTPVDTSLTCTSTLTVVATLGVARFTGCALTGLEATYTLTATDTAAQTGVSGNVTINAAGAADHIVFSVPPVSGVASTTNWPTSPSVTVEDTSDNTVTTANSITLSLSVGGVLACTGGLTMATTLGVAAFTNCNITGGANTYTLTASQGTVANITTSVSVV